MDDPRPMEESAAEVTSAVTRIIDNTAATVNHIRKGVQKSLRIAEELEGIAEDFRDIAMAQQELALRVAQLGTEALRAEYFDDDDEDAEEIEFEEADEEDEDED